MRKKIMAAVMSAGLAVSAVMPSAVFAEETTTEAQTEEIETEEAEEAEEEYDFSAGYEDNGYFKDIVALDYVELPAYTGVQLPSYQVEPTDEDVQAEIDTLMYQYTETEELTSGIVQDGDTVNIDYVGSIDGVEFDGGSTGGNGTNVTIGVTSYIDDFLEQLIGHEPGETINVEVTFPEDYGNEELNGKDAVFVTTINHIVNTIVPELDDEFVKENLEFESAEEYRQSIYDEQYASNLTNALGSYLFEEAVVSEVPESAVDVVYEYQLQYLGLIGASYGMSGEDVLSYFYGMTTDDLREQSIERARDMLILQAVMEDASLEITPEFVMEAVEASEEEYDDFVDYYGIGYVNSAVFYDCVINFMKESVEIYEAEEETTEESTELETEVETAEVESEEETEVEVSSVEAD